MAEAAIFSQLKAYAYEYFYGFDKDQLEVNLMSGVISIKSALIWPDKINDEEGLPCNIKVGMLRNVNIKLNKLKLLHEFTTAIFRSKK